jgi:cation transporter-like permease
MTRLVALRAGACFTLLAVVFGALSVVSHAAIAEALLSIAGSLCALMLVFAWATPDHVAVPIRARRSRPQLRG